MSGRLGVGATEGTRGLIRDFRVFFLKRSPAVGSNSLLVMNGWI
jgi:hypothetical protein